MVVVVVVEEEEEEEEEEKGAEARTYPNSKTWDRSAVVFVEFNTE